MTDVIHHVRDIRAMFAEMFRVLKLGGKVCIATQSHHQIENRPIVAFFPGTAAVDKDRYPDIPDIIAHAEEHNLKFKRNVVLFENEEIELGQEYMELVQKKGYSMLHLLSDNEYAQGLKRLEGELRRGPIRSRLSGETLVWLSRRDIADSHNPLLQQLRRHGVEPVIGQLADSPDEQIDLVTAGAGLCLTPASTILSVPAGQLEFRALPGFSMELDFTLAWQREASSPVASALLAEFNAAIETHQAMIASGLRLTNFARN